MVENGLVGLATNLLAIIIPTLAAMAVELLRRKLGVEKMAAIERELSAKQDLGVMAVRFAEQAYRDLGGKEKYNAAARYLAHHANARGLKVSEQEIRALIESSLRSLKENFTDAWAETIEDDDKVLSE